MFHIFLHLYIFSQIFAYLHLSKTHKCPQCNNEMRIFLLHLSNDFVEAYAVFIQIVFDELILSLAEKARGNKLTHEQCI